MIIFSLFHSLVKACSVDVLTSQEEKQVCETATIVTPLEYNYVFNYGYLS